ncbi:MAG: class A beta-lactamase-related serine hydrolase [Candidatus Sumerlaeaceae bacterium]|nr:class A beta-lactamase-related serine hydrolase [Candidatus Sumerlaeaceae bacterium]
MRHPILIGALMALAAAVCAQETKVSRHPNGTQAGVSAFRYEADPMACPPGDDMATIPPAESRRLVCELVESPLMSKNVEEWVDTALAGTMGLNKEDVFVTYLEMCRENNGPPHFGHYNGNDMQFASGISRLFYATALYWHLQRSCQPMSKSLFDDTFAMLNKGDAKATSRIVDYLTNTESGDELAGRALAQFARRRDIANMFFICCIGFENFNVNQKIWPTVPSPRDLQLLGEKLPLNYENSNRVTTNQVAALLYLIDQEGIVSRCASRRIKEMMYRPVEQAKVAPLPGIAAGLPVGAKMWSLNGYTVRNYHDAAIVSLPNGKHYILVVFTKYPKDYPTDFIPKLSEVAANRLMQSTGDFDRNGDYLYSRPLTGR